MDLSKLPSQFMKISRLTSKLNLIFRTGIYIHKTGRFLGGHAVKAIGYGHDSASGLNYWIVVNSWNQYWGESGTFKIVRGRNECGIESQGVAGMAK